MAETAPTGSSRRQSRREHLQQLLTSDGVYGTTLLVYLIDRYGTEALEWHPKTLRDELSQSIGATLPKYALDRLMAAIAVVTSNFFYKSLPRFLTLANVLAGDDFDPSVVDLVDVDDAAWAVTEAVMLAPPEEGEPAPTFDQEIKGYLERKLLQEGFVRPPEVLKDIVGRDFVDRLRFNFGEEPAMFQAMYQAQEDKANEVDSIISENLAELVGQLESLPLDEGDVSQLREQLRKGVLS